MSALGLDRRGSVILESLSALVPVSVFFVVLCQLMDLYVHRLLLQRAASAAVRAAVVVLPDDGAHYGDPDNHALHRFMGGRKAAVEAAAGLVMAASPSFRAQTTQLRRHRQPGRSSELQLDLFAEYSCFLPTVGLICGLDGKLQLHARARLAYQGADYVYSRSRST